MTSKLQCLRLVPLSKTSLPSKFDQPEKPASVVADDEAAGKHLGTGPGDFSVDSEAPSAKRRALLHSSLTTIVETFAKTSQSDAGCEQCLVLTIVGRPWRCHSSAHCKHTSKPQRRHVRYLWQAQ